MDNTYRDMMMAWRVCLSKNWLSHIGRGAMAVHGRWMAPTTSCLGSFRFKHFKDVCLCALSFMQHTSVCAHSPC